MEIYERCRFRAWALAIAIYGLLAAPAHAMESAAIEAITSAADAICGSYEKSGSSRSNSLGGEVSAQINGLLSRLADLGLKGTAATDSKRYEGVLREQLGPELQSIRRCRFQVFTALRAEIDQANPSPENAAPRTMTVNTSLLDQISRNCSVFNTSMPSKSLKVSGRQKNLLYSFNCSQESCKITRRYQKWARCLETETRTATKTGKEYQVCTKAEYTPVFLLASFTASDIDITDASVLPPPQLPNFPRFYRVSIDCKVGNCISIGLRKSRTSSLLLPFGSDDCNQAFARAFSAAAK